MSTHRCPIGDCPRQVPSHQLMCRLHWRQVPRDLQSLLYRTWRSGEGAGTQEHTDAMEMCIHAVEARS